MKQEVELEDVTAGIPGKEAISDGRRLHRWGDVHIGRRRRKTAGVKRVAASIGGGKQQQQKHHDPEQQLWDWDVGT